MTNVGTPLHANYAAQFAEAMEENDRFTTLLNGTLRDVSYRPNYHIDSDYDGGRWWIEIVHERHDAVTGQWGQGRGGKRWLEKTASRSDIIRCVFGAFAAYEEHEVREFFRYNGQQVFGPHMDLDKVADALGEGRI
jgi:hypothetical protein